MNYLFNQMVTEEELDVLLKYLADFISTWGYMQYHCYFMSKAVVMDSIDTIMKYIDKG